MPADALTQPGTQIAAGVVAGAKSEEANGDVCHGGDRCRRLTCILNVIEGGESFTTSRESAAVRARVIYGTILLAALLTAGLGSDGYVAVDWPSPRCAELLGFRC